MRIRVIIAAMILLIVGAACAPEVDLLDDDFLTDTSVVTGDPCEAPCWRGITPGETSWNDALEIIDSDETLEDLQTRSDDETGQIGAAWAQADGRSCCQMFTQDGSTVSLLVAQTAPQLTFSEIIDIYGEPTYLIGETVTSDQALVSVYYPDVPMLIYVFVEGEEDTISLESQVVGFAYTSPDVMSLIEQTSELHAWEGFQTLESYLEGDFEILPSITLTPIGGGDDEASDEE